MSNIWATLSAIDCKEHVEKKGQFSYLAWTWAWAMVKENYPYATYELIEDIVYPNDTMEVRVKVSISEQVAVDSSGHSLVFNTLSHTMWLPVLDFKNKAIQNPNAFDINSARMRCLVKCLAMFGLGHYIYAGESAPQEPPRETFKPEQREQLISLLAAKDGWGLKKLGQEVGNDIMSDLFSSFSKGEVSKTKALVRELVGQANTGLKTDLAFIEEQQSYAAPEVIQEGLDEMGDIERGFVLAGLTEVQKIQLNDMGVVLK